jgi:hypothetical protein
MQGQLKLNFDLELSADLLRHQLSRGVAELDIPLKLQKPVPLNLGRLRAGTVRTLALQPARIKLEVVFERGLGLSLELSDLRFEEAQQTLSARLERFAPQGFLGAGLVNGLRGMLLGGASRAANERVPGLLDVQGDKLTVDLSALVARALQDPELRANLVEALPTIAQPDLRILGLEVRDGSLWVRLSASA